MVELLWKCSIAILNNLLTMYIIKPTVGQQFWTSYSCTTSKCNPRSETHQRWGVDEAGH